LFCRRNSGICAKWVCKDIEETRENLNLLRPPYSAVNLELNPQVRFGKPVVKGTRTTVAEVLEMLANGRSTADIAEDFPAIGAARVRACLLYAAYRESIVLQAAA